MHLKIFPHYEVLPYTTGKHSHVRTYVIEGNRYRVAMRSSRFTLFRKNRKCVCCGLEGKWMILDLHKGHKSPHFNLYGLRNGKYILFTRDHILPRSKGGLDEQANYQTMCERCNMKKKNDNITIEELRARLHVGKTVQRKRRSDGVCGRRNQAHNERSGGGGASGTGQGVVEGAVGDLPNSNNRDGPEGIV